MNSATDKICPRKYPNCLVNIASRLNRRSCLLEELRGEVILGLERTALRSESHSVTDRGRFDHKVKCSVP